LPGLRERNKEEKRRRIQRATLEVLAEKGFDRATTNEIAARAGVAAGTIFLYAQNKVDLCLMSINDDLDKLTDVAFKAAGVNQSLLDQIITFFRHRYRFWSQHPDLYQAAVREMSTSSFSSGETGREMARDIGRRAQALQRLTTILNRSAEKGELRISTQIEGVARILLDIYLTELRFWLNADQPQIEPGIERLRYLIGIIVSLISK